MPDPTMLQIAARMLATTRSFWTSPDKTAGTVPEADPSASVHPPLFPGTRQYSALPGAPPYWPMLTTDLWR
ncbi:MAG: hypothetical protein GX049_04160 [Alcaligenaceae bacterium]|nr:hypothetical protein [Alcaligenaceae bacterium]